MENQLTPEYKITLAGKDYSLGGSFATLRAVQQGFNQDLFPLQARIIEMRVDEIAKLISLAATENVSADEIGTLLIDEMDIFSKEYGILKAHLMAWLAIAMTPKSLREKKVRDMANLIAKVTSDSPGTTTSDSV